MAKIFKNNGSYESKYYGNASKLKNQAKEARQALKELAHSYGEWIFDREEYGKIPTTPNELRKYIKSARLEFTKQAKELSVQNDTATSFMRMSKEKRNKLRKKLDALGDDRDKATPEQWEEYEQGLRELNRVQEMTKEEVEELIARGEAYDPGDPDTILPF